MKRILAIASLIGFVVVAALTFQNSNAPKSASIMDGAKTSPSSLSTTNSSNSKHGNYEMESPDEPELPKKQDSKIEEYRASLTEPNVQSPQLTSALMSLAIFRDPVAREKALELLNSPDKKLSAISYRALGYFNDPDVNKILVEKLDDQNPEIKRAALVALAWAPEEDSPRKEHLQDYNNKLRQEKTVESNQEALLLLPALYKMSKDPSDKSEWLNQIQDIAKNSTDKTQAQAAQNIFHLLSRK